MTKKRASIIAVIGPTASGKSEFAVKLARKIGGEIISADSRQVYKYLNIGSAKVLGKWIGGAFVYKDIPHHCIDFVNPNRRFTVAEYKTCSEKAIKGIQNCGKIPIIAGGTGFYIDAVLYDFQFPKVPPDEKLRKKLERLSPAELFTRLKKLDPRRAANIDRHNKRRLVRALEIIIKTGKPIPQFQAFRPSQGLKIIKLKVPAEKLKKRIEKRLEERLKHGLIEEVRNLRKKHKLSWKRLDDLGLEYRHVSRYLRGLIDYEEMKRKINVDSRRYAKKQVGWFKNY